MNQINIASYIAASSQMGQPSSILVVTTCWWPSLARFAHLLTLAGCRVSILCPPGHPVRAVPGVKIFKQQWRHPMRAISDAIKACDPTIVIPADDRAVANLHELHGIGTPAEQYLLERSLGAPAGYPVTDSRIKLLNMARNLGILVPESQLIETEADLDIWLNGCPGPWVMKATGSWGGMGVRVAETPEKAKAAFRKLRNQPTAPIALKRMLVNLDPFWTTDLMRRSPSEMVAQAYVRGRPGDLAMFCWNGDVLAVTMAEVVASAGENRPATIVRLIDRPDFLAAAKALAWELQLTGFYGLDFMIEENTDRAFLIELNPRPTTLTNVRLQASGDLISKAVGMFAGFRQDRLPPKPANELVAYFPQAWKHSQDDEAMAQAHQDVPWEEPVLMKEMLRESWPDRQMLARCHTHARNIAGYVAGRLRQGKT